MAALNFHHLRYFYAIAQAGTLTKAAAQLAVSASSLSVQVQQLEHQLGHALFERRGRKLVLTEAGHIALERADEIFEAGDELLRALKGAHGARQQAVRIGALSTLSRNFQLDFLKPLIARGDVRINLRSGSMRELMHMLNAHMLDVLLTNTLPARDDASTWSPHIIADQPISLIGPPRRAQRSKEPVTNLVRTARLIVPTPENHIRAEFDALMVRLGLTPSIAAEVDDMAMLRLLTREGVGLAVAPAIVMRDELGAGLLADYGPMPALREVFYAITPARRFPHPLVAALLTQQKSNESRSQKRRAPRRRARA